MKNPKIIHADTCVGETICGMPLEDLRSFDVLASKKKDVYFHSENFDQIELCRFCYTEYITEFK